MPTPKLYYCSQLTGSGAGALAAIDGDGLYDRSIGFTLENNIFHVHILDEDSGLPQDVPNVIIPNTNAGDKRWILQDLCQNAIPGGTWELDSTLVLKKGDSGWVGGHGGVLWLESDGNADLQFIVPNNQYSHIFFGDEDDHMAGDFYFDHNQGTKGAFVFSANGQCLKMMEGRCFVQTPNSAPTDTHLAINSINIYLDEANNKLKFRVKYSGGTLKTGEISLT